jgi:hypothetical protein
VASRVLDSLLSSLFHFCLALAAGIDPHIRQGKLFARERLFSLERPRDVSYRNPFRANVVLCPPKPNELVSTMSRSACRALCGT